MQIGSPAESTREAYGGAVRRFLANRSEEAAGKVAQLAREVAALSVPLHRALGTLWRAGRPRLDATLNSSQAIESLLEMEQVLCSAFERAAELERQAHQRLASAYSQKVREVNTLLDSLPAYVMIKDAAFRYISANRPYYEALGKTVQQLTARNDFDFFPDEVARQLAKQDAQVLASGELVRQELTIDFNDRQRTVLLIKAPILYPSGRTSGLVGVGFDITNRKRIENEHRVLAAALESAGESIFTTDSEGIIQYVNPAFVELTGYSAEEAVGKNNSLLDSGLQDVEFSRQMQETLAEGNIWQGVGRGKKKNGEIFDADVTVAPLRNFAGKTAFVVVQRDITERNRIVETLRQAVLVKAEFTSMVSHELRTPLTAIKEAVDIVEDGTAGPVNPNQAQFLVLAKRNIDRLHRLINDTLDFAKLERGDFRVRLELHDLNTIVREVVMQQRLAAEKQGLQLDLVVDETLPAVPIDPDRISQVLVNLINNAVRHCPGGCIEVRTEKCGEECVVKVQDNGPGIPEDKLEEIFQAFVQLSTGPGRKVGGTGLGLAICKRIVELHGGRIWVESEEGRGSAFYFAIHLTANVATARSSA